MRFLGNSDIFRHGAPGHYSTNFEDNIEGKVEHFDVYGEVCKLNFRRREKQTFSHCWFCAVAGANYVLSSLLDEEQPNWPAPWIGTQYWKTTNLFPGKIHEKRNRIWPKTFLERKYFQKRNIFRDETFSEKIFFQVKRFQGKVMAITGYEVDQVVLNRRPSPSPYQANQHIIFATQRNPRWPTQVTKKSQRPPKTPTRRV